MFIRTCWLELVNLRHGEILSVEVEEVLTLISHVMAQSFQLKSPYLLSSKIRSASLVGWLEQLRIIIKRSGDEIPAQFLKISISKKHARNKNLRRLSHDWCKGKEIFLCIAPSVWESSKYLSIIHIITITLLEHFVPDID